MRSKILYAKHIYLYSEIRIKIFYNKKKLKSLFLYYF